MTKLDVLTERLGGLARIIARSLKVGPTELLSRVAQLEAEKAAADKRIAGLISLNVRLNSDCQEVADKNKALQEEIGKLSENRARLSTCVIEVIRTTAHYAECLGDYEFIQPRLSRAIAHAKAILASQA